MTEPVKTSSANPDEHRREIATKLNLILQGRLNIVGALTLVNGTTSTIVTNALITPSSVILLMPLSSVAATAHNSTYVSARSTGTLTLTHANPGADAGFAYVLLG